MAPGIDIPRALLLACAPFADELPAMRVASAIAAGVSAAGMAEPDVLALPAHDCASRAAQQLLDEEHYDERMRAARAVVIGVPLLEERTLAGSLPFELATRARQAGVPCYAIVRENRLSSFDERILDLQTVLVAHGASALRRAGRRLAELA